MHLPFGFSACTTRADTHTASVRLSHQVEACTAQVFHWEHTRVAEFREPDIHHAHTSSWPHQPFLLSGADSGTQVRTPDGRGRNRIRGAIIAHPCSHARYCHNPHERLGFHSDKEVRMTRSFPTHLSVINRHAPSVEVLLERLVRMNVREQLGLREEDLVRLKNTYPTRPSGAFCFRSLRIRVGEGSRGVANTFRLHARLGFEALGIHVPHRHWRSFLSIPSSGDRVPELHLFSGDQTHHAHVEWIIIDTTPGTCQEPIRRTHRLADELLALMWLYPDFFHEMMASKRIVDFWLMGYAVVFPQAHAPAKTYGVNLSLVDATSESPASYRLGLVGEEDQQAPEVYQDPIIAVPSCIIPAPAVP